MTNWTAFSAAAPDLAAAGRKLIYRGAVGEVLLATVRGDAPPRIHPIWIAIAGDRLCAFILPSSKRTDLEQDGRYALHTHPDPAAPSEFSLRGRALRIGQAADRAAVASAWYFAVDESYELFEFSIEAALLGVRENADAWPPRYTSWRAP